MEADFHQCIARREQALENLACVYRQCWLLKHAGIDPGKTTSMKGFI
jgi:hypothetical protein